MGALPRQKWRIYWVSLLWLFCFRLLLISSPHSPTIYFPPLLPACLDRAAWHPGVRYPAPSGMLSSALWMFKFLKTLILSPWLGSKIVLISSSIYVHCDAHDFLGISHIVSQGNAPCWIALPRKKIFSFHTLEHPYPPLGLQLEIFGFLTNYPLPGLNCFVQFGIIFIWTVTCKAEHPATLLVFLQINPANLFSFFPRALSL